MRIVDGLRDGKSFLTAKIYGWAISRFGVSHGCYWFNRCERTSANPKLQSVLNTSDSLIISIPSARLYEMNATARRADASCVGKDLTIKGECNAIIPIRRCFEEQQLVAGFDVLQSNRAVEPGGR